MTELKACENCDDTWVIKKPCDFCLGGTIQDYLPRRSLDPYVVRPRCSTCDGKNFVITACYCVWITKNRRVEDDE